MLEVCRALCSTYSPPNRPPPPPPPPPWHLVAQCGSVLGLRAAKGQSLVGTLRVSSRFGDESIQAEGNCHGSIVWLEPSHGMTAPWFESRSGIVLCRLFRDQFRCRNHQNKHHHSGFGASIQEESHRSWCQNHPGAVPCIVTYFV